MKHYTMYVCETCGYENRSRDDVEEHEASHLGLTVKEMHEYQSLISFAQYMSWKNSYASNEETRRKFDEAIDNLVSFEEEHGLKETF